jgi:hypothetical protein
MTLAGSAQELPNQAKSVEFVFVRPASDRTSYFYEKYEGLGKWRLYRKVSRQTTAPRFCSLNGPPSYAELHCVRDLKYLRPCFAWPTR